MPPPSLVDAELWSEAPRRWRAVIQRALSRSHPARFRPGGAHYLLLVNGWLGYAIDRFLLYGSGDYARSKIEVQTDFDDPVLNLTDDRRVSGWNIAVASNTW